MEQKNPIAHPKLKQVNGIFRIKKVLLKALFIILISALVASFAGYKIQKGYRDLTGYKSTAEELVEPVEIESTEEKGLLDKSIGYLSNTLDSAKEKIAETSVVKKTNELFYGLLEAIDRALFWGTFLLVFFITAWVLEKLLAIKKVFTQSVDPDVDENIKSLEGKIKELVDEINKLKSTG